MYRACIRQPCHDRFKTVTNPAEILWHCVIIGSPISYLSLRSWLFEFSELCVTFWLEFIPRPNWPCCGYEKSSTRSGLSNTCRIKSTRRVKCTLESKRRTKCKTMLICGIYKQRVTPRGDRKVHFEHPTLYFVRLIQYRGAQELDEFISQLENESERKKLANLVMTG